jgi:hypothetical protein
MEIYRKEIKSLVNTDSKAILEDVLYYFYIILVCVNYYFVITHKWIGYICRVRSF